MGTTKNEERRTKNENERTANETASRNDKRGARCEAPVVPFCSSFFVLVSS